MNRDLGPIGASGAQPAEARTRMARALGTGLLAIGFALLLVSVYTAIDKYKRIGQWTPVEALLLDFKLVNEPHGRVVTDYRAHFTFQYDASGRTWVSSTASDYTTSSASEIRAWRLNFQPGHHLQIRFNPAQPSEITTDNLDLRSFRQPLWVAGWSVLILLVSILFRKL